MHGIKDKFIIGGGITGLVWKFYHPEYRIITPDIGGSYGKNHMVWLHDTYETRKLLTDLGLPVKPKKSYIGYFYKGWVTENQTNEMNLLMIQKKMTQWDKSLDVSFVPKTRDLSLSMIGGMNYLNSLSTDLTEVIKLLSEKNTDSITGFVTDIGQKHIKVKNKDGASGTYEYSHLVSTMAAPFFWKAYGITDKDFKCLPITNIVVSKRPKEYDDRYEMIYYDDSVPFSRGSFIDGSYALEFTGEITKEEFQKLYPDLPILEYFVVKQGRIFESENISPQENITFSGRFGQWKYGITSEHVVAQALHFKK